MTDSQQQMEEWEKVNTGGTKTDSVWNPEENKELVGEYVESIPNQGQYNSTHHVLKTDDGKLVKAYGSAVLDQEMAKTEIGSRVKIVFAGLGTSKSGRPFKRYDVYRSKKVVEPAKQEASADMPF